jgi:hypothetical protein
MQRTVVYTFLIYEVKGLSIRHALRGLHLPASTMHVHREFSATAIIVTLVERRRLEDRCLYALAACFATKRG